MSIANNQKKSEINTPKLSLSFIGSPLMGYDHMEIVKKLLGITSEGIRGYNDDVYFNFTSHEKHGPFSKYVIKVMTKDVQVPATIAKDVKNELIQKGVAGPFEIVESGTNVTIYVGYNGRYAHKADETRKLDRDGNRKTSFNDIPLSSI